jgi:hypothetical protein
MVTVTLPVDTRLRAAPVVSVTGTTSSTVGLAWGPGRRRRLHLLHVPRLRERRAPVLTQSPGERAVPVLRHLLSGTVRVSR